MAPRIRFDEQDKRALRALDDDVTIIDSNEVAVIAGEMAVEIARLASDGGDQFWLWFTRRRTARHQDPTRAAVGAA
jgi:fatty acid-binding protein DegV